MYNLLTVYNGRAGQTVKGKTYVRILLRHSVRVDKKVTHPVMANVSHCAPEEIAALEVALRHKHALAALRELASGAVEVRQSPSMGAVWLLHDVAQRTGIAAALGHTPEGRLALWQALARTLEQGSRLSAVRLAQAHAACAVLGLEPFHEDHLYANLAWLAQEQRHIEQRLYRHTPRAPFPGVVLYDVASTYVEGTCNALAAWGYNRDGKRGKQQIVINGRVVDCSIPEPSADVQRLLAQVGVKLPRRITPDWRRVPTNTRMPRKRVRD